MLLRRLLVRVDVCHGAVSWSGIGPQNVTARGRGQRNCGDGFWKKAQLLAIWARNYWLFSVREFGSKAPDLEPPTLHCLKEEIGLGNRASAQVLMQTLSADSQVLRRFGHRGEAPVNCVLEFPGDLDAELF
jgi:hypothetical protein